MARLNKYYKSLITGAYLGGYQASIVEQAFGNDYTQFCVDNLKIFEDVTDTVTVEDCLKADSYAVALTLYKDDHPGLTDKEALEAIADICKKVYSQEAVNAKAESTESTDEEH